MTDLGYVSLPRLDVLVAESLEEALQAIEREPDRTVLAGGTHTIPSIVEGVNKTRKLLDVSGLKHLRFIRNDSSRVEVGALTTHAEVAEELGDGIPAFKSFLNCYSSPSVMNRATVGGSIMLRNCSEDLIPILLTLDAELVFQTVRGEERVTLQEFLDQNINQRALLTKVVFRSRRMCFFDKLWLGVSRIPIISVAVSFDGDDHLEPKVAVSHKSRDKPGRVHSVERFLQGRLLDRPTCTKAAEMVSQSIDPPDDVIAPAWYRREVAGVLIRRILERVASHED
ncbi:MAG: FAD binding domain-containing protein [Candidatus Caldarchaeum sp.]